MRSFALSIFVGAFLLFQVQPLIAKYLLPWFGGGQAIWTTCMLFFQVFLLLGYTYAHLSIRYLRPRTQAVVHMALLGLAMTALPLVPAESLRPEPGTDPTWGILLLLATVLGLPYLLLAATSPLLQAWFARSRPGASPYRLYALSNFGSLLALLSYPFLFEPLMARHTQAEAWSVLFVVFGMACAVCAMRIGKGAATQTQVVDAKPPATPAPHWTRYATWIGLAACASLMLLAVTNRLCEEIAPTPFLWVVPLAVYLVSFIVAFDNPRWYSRRAFATLLFAALGASAAMPLFDVVFSLPVQTAVLGFLLFAVCMLCHGELYRLRPAAVRLTGFYLTISLGGALGGLFVAVIAPLIFDDYWEMNLGMFATMAVLFGVLLRDPESRLYRGRKPLAWGGLCAVAVAICAAMFVHEQRWREGAVLKSRGFYGVLTVYEYAAKKGTAHSKLLAHGTTTHGLQITGSELSALPTTYYILNSGVGRAFFTAGEHKESLRIGVIGLGVGTLAAYGREGDVMRIYEIDPQVVAIAQDEFTFLEDSPAEIEIVQGDARIQMEREAPQQYDLLILDAFSGDAVPVHLLTMEAFAIYQRHLANDGVIAVHVSNKYLDLDQVVGRLAVANDFVSLDVRLPETQYPSQWMLLARDAAWFDTSHLLNGQPMPVYDYTEAPLWTDEENSLLAVLSSSARAGR